MRNKNKFKNKWGMKLRGKLDLSRGGEDWEFQNEIDTHRSPVCNAKDLKQPECLSIGNWLNKLSSSHTTEDCLSNWFLKSRSIGTYVEQSLRHCADSSPFVPVNGSLPSLPALLCALGAGPPEPHQQDSWVFRLPLGFDQWEVPAADWRKEEKGARVFLPSSSLFGQ